MANLFVQTYTYTNRDCNTILAVYWIIFLLLAERLFRTNLKAT